MKGEISGGQLQVDAIRRALLRWYRAHARDLPWRKTREPYPVWISEVMLQQTQITTVRPYYLRFLRAFPTVERLASAPFENVAEQWSGLGYYRRARSLHLAAQKLVKESAGRFPSEYSAARKLPGVGHYTACAVLSIAYDRPLAVMDGNAARVIARIAAVPGHLQQARFRKDAERIAQELLSPMEPGLSNQALMELGQTICLPRAPRCQACALRLWCRARQQGQPEAFPEPRPRRAAEARHLAVAIIRKGKRVALTRGLDEGLLAGIWNFPAAFGSSPQEALENLRHKIRKEAALPVQWGPLLGRLRHQITHRSIRADLYAASPRDRAKGRGLRWLAPDKVDCAAVSQLARKIARAIGSVMPQKL